MSRGDAYIGLMSGTSLDGISACVVRFAPRATTERPASDAVHSPPGRAGTSGPLTYELLAFQVSEYDAQRRERLLAVMQSGTARDYCRIAFDLGDWLASAALAVLTESGVPRDEIRAIGSHGQTLWHEAPHSTWQIGEAAVIAERLGIDVVSDFRVRDVAAGGQGAPLVPVADALLFSADHWRALQNIGGIGNVTIVPPGGAAALETDGGSVRAFDTGPGVGVLDAVVRALRPELRFDRDGRIARSGTPIDAVLDELLAHAYFAAPPPKSTGRELFTPEYVGALIGRCRSALRSGGGGGTDEDIVATATALTARSIADAYRRFMPEPVDEVLVSGGGAKNGALMEMLRSALAPMRVLPFDEVYFDGEAKEAVAFALLAKLFMDGVSGNVASATGARGPRMLGKLTPGNVRNSKERS